MPVLSGEPLSAPPVLTTVTIYGHQAPSTRVRVTDWLSYLGIDAEELNYADLLDARPKTILPRLPSVLIQELRTRRASRASRQLLLISREASPFSHGGLEERFIRSADHSVYDFDDALFEDGVGFRRLYGRATKCRRAVSAADVVVVGNDNLAEWATQHSRDVRVIPSCVDPASYQVKDSWTVSKTPVIVWLGSRGTEHYIESIADELRRLCGATGARVRIISKPRSQESPALEGLVDREPWDLSTMPGLLASADLAIAPLDDSAFSRGKCAYKLLQYASAGLPIVGSPVGANQLALERFHGIAVRTGESWADAITEVLGESDEVRRRRGLTGVTAVREHYSFRAWEDQWIKAVGLS